MPYTSLKQQRAVWARRKADPEFHAKFGKHTPRNLTYEMDAKERAKVKRVAKQHGLKHNSHGLLVALKEKLATESITRDNALPEQGNTMDNLRDRLVKLAKPSMGRIGEAIIGEKAVNPTMQAVKGILPFGSLWGGTKGHRLGHFASTVAGAASPIPFGSAVGAGLHGAYLAKQQQAKLRGRVGAGIVAVGGTAGAAAGLDHYRKSKHAAAELLEKEAKPAIGRLGERLLGEKAIDPAWEATKGVLPFGSLFGVKGHRLSHFAATMGGGMAGGMAGGAAGKLSKLPHGEAIGARIGGAAGSATAAGLNGSRLAKAQQGRLKTRLTELVAVGGAGTAAVGGGAYALNKYRKKK